MPRTSVISYLSSPVATAQAASTVSHMGSQEIFRRDETRVIVLTTVLSCFSGGDDFGGLLCCARGRRLNAAWWTTNHDGF